MPTTYSSKYNEPVFVNDFTMVKFSYPTNQNMDFIKIPYSDLGGMGYHFVEVKSIEVDSSDNIVSFDANIDNIVWDRGSSNYFHKLNFNYIEGNLYVPQSSQIIRDIDFINIEFYIPQLFNWNDVYGILLSVKGTETDDIYVSKIIRINDFNISSEKRVLYGSQWLESHKFNIPSRDEELYIQTIIIHNSDISNLGYLYDYPNQYFPLIQNKPLPDYIITEAYFDSLNFLHLFPKTRENKTLENSLKDYFGYERDKIINIQLSHIISWEGINQTTGQFQNFVMRVSNEENNLNESVVGLNLQDFIDVNNPRQVFDIDIQTEIVVEGKIMNRYTRISTDFASEIIKLKNELQNPTSVIFENITEINEIRQTVIEKSTDTKFVKIYQPVFVKYIENTIEYDRMYVTFTELSEPAYLKVGDEKIETSITSDGKYYFDLTKLRPLQSDTEYEIITQSNEIKIGSGIIKV